jgi:two-component system, response regulator PdtaR
MHALIIEDEPLVALLIEDHLRAIGYSSIAFAVTEDDAVAAALRHRPDLITSDVRLACGCGISAVAAICILRDIPVVFITASGQDVRRRMEGATVVAKPFTAAGLSLALSAAGAA